MIENNSLQQNSYPGELNDWEIFLHNKTKKTKKIQGIDIENCLVKNTILDGIVTKIINGIDGFIIDGKRKIFDVGNNYFVIQYDNAKEFEEDYQMFTLEGSKIIGNLHVPKSVGKFVYSEKIYVIIKPPYDISEDISGKGIFRGMVVCNDFFSEEEREGKKQMIQNLKESLSNQQGIAN